VGNNLWGRATEQSNCNIAIVGYLRLRVCSLVYSGRDCQVWEQLPVVNPGKMLKRDSFRGKASRGLNGLVLA
jgi:hypothetical protein